MATELTDRERRLAVVIGEGVALQLEGIVDWALKMTAAGLTPKMIRFALTQLRDRLNEIIEAPG